MNITLHDAGNKEDDTSIYLLTEKGKYGSRLLTAGRQKTLIDWLTADGGGTGKDELVAAAPMPSAVPPLRGRLIARHCEDRVISCRLGVGL